MTAVSSRTQYTYTIDIYLPPSYDSAATMFPTIYALDGDARFSGMNTRFTDLKEVLQRRGVDAILVGIGGTERRQTDYNFPGAYQYHEFLATELVPYIDARYRTNKSVRALSGLSTSGTFAATALFIEAPSGLLFSHFISAEGAFWQQRDQVYALERAMFDAARAAPLPVTLMLARSSFTGLSNEAEVRALYDQIASRRYSGLQLMESSFPFGHAAMDIPSFEDAVVKFFK